MVLDGLSMAPMNDEDRASRRVGAFVFLVDVAFVIAIILVDRHAPPPPASGVDTSAAIRTQGLLGDQFVALEPGAEDELLVSGEDFSFTESAVNLDKLIGSVVHGDGLGGGD